VDAHEIRSIVERMARAWMQQDVEAIAALFSDDGIFISPGGMARGREAIAAAARAFFAEADDVEVTITRILVAEQAGAVEWRWQETSRSTGERRTMEDAIVFELRDGKLTYWREYFDPAQTEQLSARHP
jgi:uncharacterized protein (TIGR02246 family)